MGSWNVKSRLLNNRRRIALVVISSWLVINALLIGDVFPEGAGQVPRQYRRLVGLAPASGFHRRVFRDADGQLHRYVVYVPNSLQAGDRPPLILYLNGRGRNGNDGLMPLIDGLAPAIWDQSSSFPFVVVWPQCPAETTWNGSDAAAKMAMAILERTAAEYQADRDRVYLTGLSSGGWGVWSMGAAYPEAFAALVPISAGGIHNEDVDRVAESGLPVWSFSVDNDRTDVVEGTRHAHARLLELGRSPRLTEVSADPEGSMDRHDAWSFAYRTPALFDWLLSQRRSARAAGTARFELQPPGQFPTQVRGDAVPLLSRISAQNLTELHVEFRPAKGLATFGIGVLRPDVDRADKFVQLATCDTGGVSSRQRPIQCARHPLPQSADLPLQWERWNDLRLKFADGRFAVDLNGWTLPSIPFNSSFNEVERISFAASGAADAAVELRNLRVLRGLEPTTQSVMEASFNQNDEIEASNPVAVADVLKAWRIRTDSATNLKLQWRTRFSSIVPPIPSQSNTVTLKGTTSELTLNAGTLQARTQWRHPQVRIDRRRGLHGEPSQREYAQILSGGFANQFVGRSESMYSEVRCDSSLRQDEVFVNAGHGVRGFEYPHPDVWQERVGNLDDLLWRAPLLDLSPLAPGAWGLEWDRCRILPERQTIASVNCAVLEELTQLEGQSCIRRFWIDPRRDFRILRACVSIDGSLRERIDLQYRDGEGQGCPLETWTVVVHQPPAGSTSPRYFPGNAFLFECAAARIVEFKSKEIVVKSKSREDFRLGTTIFTPAKNLWTRQVGNGKRQLLSSVEIAAITQSSVPASRWSGATAFALILGIFVLGFVGVCARRARLAS